MSNLLSHACKDIDLAVHRKTMYVEIRGHQSMVANKHIWTSENLKIFRLFIDKSKFYSIKLVRVI